MASRWAGWAHFAWGSGIRCWTGALEAFEPGVVPALKWTDVKPRNRFSIPHEYHLVHGADHLGASLTPRIEEGLGFLNRMMNPWKATPGVTTSRKLLEQMKRAYRSKY